MDAATKALCTPDARRALERFVNSADPATTRLGWQYFKEGRVREHWIQDGALHGELREVKMQTASLALENGRWIPRCDCAMPQPCKHAHALANFWIDLLDRALRPGAVMPSPRVKPSAEAVARHYPPARTMELPFGESQPPASATSQASVRGASSSGPSAAVPPQTVSKEVPNARLGASASFSPSSSSSSSPQDPSAKAQASANAPDSAAASRSYLAASAAASGSGPGSSRPAPAPRQPTWLELAHRDAESALRRPLNSVDRTQLDQLQALYLHVTQKRFGRVFHGDLRRHGFLLPGFAQCPDNDQAFAGWWDPQNPPAGPWEFWQFLALAYEDQAQKIPSVLAWRTDTSKVRPVVEALSADNELRQWQQDLAGPALAPAHKSFCHALRLKLTTDSWILQLQATPEDRFVDAKAAFYHELDTRLSVDDFVGLPPAMLFLASLICGAHGFRRDARSKENLVRAFSAYPGFEECLAGPDERVFAVQPVTLEQGAFRGPKGRVVFTLQLPDGTRASEARLLTQAPFPVYLWKGKLWRGPAPLPKASAPERILNDPGLVRTLQDRGVSFAPELALRVRRIHLRTRIECRLAPGIFGGKESFVLRLGAVVPEGGQVCRWTDSGWHWEGNRVPPERAADGCLLDHDRSEAMLVAARLPELRLGILELPGDEWYCELTKAFPDLFAEWRASLPAGVELLADNQLAGLVGGPWRARISVGAVPAASTGPSRDWFDIRIGMQIPDTTLSEEETALLLKARGKWVRLARHGFRRLELEGGAEGEDAALLDQLGLSAQEVVETAKGAVHRVHALQLAAAASHLSDAALVTRLQERVAALNTEPAALPAGLRAQLRPYQVEGFQFLAYLSRNGFGGILADDMGLGKTLQTLAWFLHLRELCRLAGKPFLALVVCPKSVTHGWLTECARFSPDISAVSFVAGWSSQDLPASGLLVCNYAQLRLNADIFQGLTWDALVLDEGQFIKNPASQVAVTARSLKATHRMVLTGTPVENRILDLWSLFAFAQPGLLGNQAGFRRQYPQEDPDALSRLRRRTRHFLLRRTKSQVATDLPARIEDEIVVDLEDSQQALYAAELKRAQQELLKVREPSEFDAVRFSVLTSLLRLRQICCHPGLVAPELRGAPSAKLEALIERVEELREEGHKVLVFSQFVGMLEIIAERLGTERIPHLLLTGQTEDRASLVKRFQEDDDVSVFLLSIRAAGFGLTLTAADYVVLYDPWWNPAVEAQAIDRAHRIGQTEVVTAYRLIAAGTVEEKIRLMQRDKAALAGSIVQEESLSSVMDLDSLREILG